MSGSAIVDSAQALFPGGRVTSPSGARRLYRTFSGSVEDPRYAEWTELSEVGFRLSTAPGPDIARRSGALRTTWVGKAERTSSTRSRSAPPSRARPPSTCSAHTRLVE